MTAQPRQRARQSSQPLTTRVIDTLDAMREIRPAYEEVAAACDALPFVSWDWLHRWCENAGDGYQVRLLTFWDGLEMKGALPLMQVNHGITRGLMRELRFASDCVLFSPTYMDLVARPGAEGACLAHAFGYLARDPNWDRIELCRLRADSRNLPLMCRAASERGLRTEVRRYVESPVIALPKTFDEYLNGLSSHRRRRVRSERKRLIEDHAIHFVQCTDSNTIDALLERHFTWKAERMRRLGKWTPYTDPVFRRFTRAVIHDFRENGWLRVWYLEAQREPVAIAFLYVANSTCYHKTDSFDERWGKRHVIDVLQGYCIESAIAEKLQVFDLLSTPYAHKVRYAKQAALVVKLVIYRPLLRSLLFEALAHASAVPAALIRRSRDHRESATEITAKPA
jgi:CelD/BcsL family acetyltransferase involved in cellulose biosynthesis